jgi:type IV secretory pathway VirB4 component
MASANARATQEYVPIKEVRDGIVVLKDGSLRGLVLTSSINFSLKSDDERQATIYQFQNFLNSLDFSIQIFIQSRKLDIRPYIALMEQREKKQNNELMKIQTREYIEFIKNFTKSTNIMTKHFFIVVPYTPGPLNVKPGSSALSSLSSILPKKKGDTNTMTEEQAFAEHRAQLEQRIAVVEQGLVQCGLRMVELGTEEIVELFYKIFNPGDAEKPIQLNAIPGAM